MRNLLLFIIFSCFSITGFSASTPSAMAANSKAQHQFGNADGHAAHTIKKLRKTLKLQKRGIFPERDELTEGFQALPFFASLLTFGVVSFIMLFTARDSNALRWALLGGSIGALAFTVYSLLVASGGQ